MESLLLINDPVLIGFNITLEPNEGIRFWKELSGLLGHLKGHLHNHDITIDVIVNESFEKRTLMTKIGTIAWDKPSIDLLRTTFGLDLNG
jgi:hypothetical protein